jgi:hypothetical protein
VVVIRSFKDICLAVFLIVGFALHSSCGVGIMRIIFAVRKDVDVVLLCMLLWIVGFSTLFD